MSVIVPRGETDVGMTRRGGGGGSRSPCPRWSPAWDRSHQAEFDDHTIDLHLYSGWGSITIIVPRDVGVQVTRHRSRVDSPRLEPPVPGLPLTRLDVTANIGRVHLGHPGTQDRSRRWPGSRRR